jgi:hypothetical protein
MRLINFLLIPISRNWVDFQSLGICRESNAHWRGRNVCDVAAVNHHRGELEYLPAVVIYTFLLIETGGPVTVSLCNCLLNEAQTSCSTGRYCDGNNDAVNQGPHDILLGPRPRSLLQRIRWPGHNRTLHLHPLLAPLFAISADRLSTSDSIQITHHLVLRLFETALIALRLRGRVCRSLCDCCCSNNSGICHYATNRVSTDSL